MGAKHTPGPWSWVDTSWEYNHIYAARKLCATIHTDADVTEETEDACAKVMNANARLIAAAPDLLEACIQAAIQFRFYEQQHLAKNTPEADAKAHSNHAMAKICEAAIAKATGETK